MPPKYKPGGKRFPPRASSKSIAKKITKDPGSESSDHSASGLLDQEAENRFELELCWCIQQLEITVNGGKLGEKQLLEGTKTLNLLKSNTAELIRKRQAMRNTFGDYRAKMMQDEKKYGRYVSNFKFSGTKVDINKSVFVKKAMNNEAGKQIVDKISGEGDNEEGINCKEAFVMKDGRSDVPFKFNFCVSESE